MDIITKVLEEEEGLCGWAAEGKTVGGIDVQRKIALAAGVYETQLLAKFRLGLIREGTFLNLCQ